MVTSYEIKTPDGAGVLNADAFKNMRAYAARPKKVLQHGDGVNGGWTY